MHRTENFYKLPCNRNCEMKKFWLTEVPELGQQINLSTILICLGCIHFERRSHYISDVEG
jgi:hypothetical protein